MSESKKYIADIPELLKEWDYERNIDVRPETVSIGSSSRKFWWICSVCGKPFSATPDHRSRKRKDGSFSGCPECKDRRTASRMSKRNLIQGENDLLTLYPDIAVEWDYSANIDRPEDHTPGENTKVSWICPKKHRYKMAIANRTKRGQGCSICAGKVIVPGINDLASRRPDIASQWDYQKNDRMPTEVAEKSGYDAFWICEKGHKYQMIVSERTRTDGKAMNCPVCANKQVLKGFNDLETFHPDLAREWDFEKNEKLPSEYTSRSGKTVYWKCTLGHSYKQRIADRTDPRRPQGCPYCAGKKLLAGFNDLKTLFPEVAAEWDYENNRTVPEDHIAGSHSKANWICSRCGHRWPASIKERTYHGTNCPKCSFYYKTSVPEQAIFFFIKRHFNDAINSYKPGFLNGMEIDVFIPSLNLGIEYDGSLWHENNERDRRKSQLLKENGIQLIRIKEKNEENPYGDLRIIKSEYRDRLSEMQNTLISLFSFINDFFGVNIPLDFNVEEFSLDIFFFSDNYKKSRSLLASNSPVLAEWDYEDNDPVTPDNVSAHSRKEFYWICSKCGKKWKQSIKTKVKGGLYCESCSKSAANNERAIMRIKDGKTKSIADFPEIAKEWIDERDPTTVSRGSEYRAKWKCSVCGNEFPMAVKARTLQGQGCPECGRKKSALSRTKKRTK